MRGAYVVVVSLLVGLGVYAIPNLLEFSLLGFRLSPWLSCVILADLLGCGILFLLGFRRLALLIYLLASTFEAALLISHRVSPHGVVWLTNLIPAVAVAAILVKAALRTLILED